MRILGIDPGYERLGIAVVERTASAEGYGASRKEKVIFSECFKTSAKLDFGERLMLLGEEMQKVIKKYKPEMLSIETLFMHSNQKTVMRVSEVRGALIYIAKSAGLEIFEATPLQIKVATTGYGRADKNQIIKMVKMLVDVDLAKKSDDELDAIAIALTAFAYSR